MHYTNNFKTDILPSWCMIFRPPWEDMHKHLFTPGRALTTDDRNYSIQVQHNVPVDVLGLLIRA